MSELRELYQELILDHGRQPRNCGALADANHIKEGYNPLCGDKLKLYIREENGIVQDVKFEGEGCAISMASASMMTQALKGKTVAEAQQLFELFHQGVTKDLNEADEKKLGKLIVLSGVKEFPMRVKCATLAWHTMCAALDDDAGAVSTE
jgi:nitrogen fixation protein NifU and related proteins